MLWVWSGELSVVGVVCCGCGVVCVCVCVCVCVRVHKHLFALEHVLVEVLLQLLVGVVDTKLFK